ncbi:MAG: EAL domain-containing protein, partial [Actinobacteria bacterium]|nr:EAL domain-containing protein [Actinomycetota bacterium]
LALENRALTECLEERRPASRGEGFDLFLKSPDGEARPVISRAAPVIDSNGKLLGAVGTIDDIAKLQLYDPLTGLPGHGILIDRLQGAMDDAARERSLVGLLVVVVDRFDVLRSSLRPAVSAAIISGISDELEQAIDCDDVRQRSASASVAYLGNAEFAVVLPCVAAEEDAIFIGELLSERLSHTVDVEGIDVPITVSVAVGVSQGDDEPAALLAAAAASARRQQVGGGGGVATSDSAVHAAVLARLQMESELRRAIGNGEIVVHYQPQVQVAGGAPVGVEALVRWEHPERGLLGAGDIIPLAVESGLILPLSWHVLDVAARQVAQWRRELPGAEAMSLSVNVAAEQLSDKDVVGRVAEITSETGLDPSALVLEITEGTVMGDTRAIGERLAAIKALGVQIAIDDFSTGYSSLLQLRELPVDILKIDSRFVAAMCEEAGDAAIVTGSIRLGRALGLEIVAEGVETSEQLVQLRVLGCELALGYLFAKPLPADALASWWRDQPRLAAPGTVAGSLVLDDQGEDETLAYLIHELRSPLIAIGGFAQMLAEIPLSDQGREFLDVIVRSTRELDARLSSVREARDVLEGGMTLELAGCDLAEVVRTLVNDMEAQLAPHPVRFESAGDATTLADRARLTQAVSNLLTNAAKFSSGDSPIDVTVRSANGEVVITVRDRGVGIPEHRRPELFRRFSRLGSRTKGMGIGLYVARVATIAHGGDVGHEPAPGGGSIFSIRIPQTSPAGLASAAGPISPVSTGATPPAPAAGPRTVLYIEDSEASVALAQLVADGLHNVTLLVAEDGLTGIDMARSHRPDLVLLDLQLPDLPGEDVLASLRSDPHTAEVPVIIASADVGDRSAALRASGAAGIMRKPFDLDRLRSVIRGDLSSAGAVEDEAVLSRPHGNGPTDPLDRTMVAALEELASSSPAGDFDDAIVTFERSVMVSLGALQQAAEERHTQDISRIAHEMAGAAANFGAHIVSRMCREIELAVINGDVSSVASLVTELAVQLDEAVRALRLVFPAKSRA